MALLCGRCGSRSGVVSRLIRAISLDLLSRRSSPQCRHISFFVSPTVQGCRIHQIHNSCSAATAVHQADVVSTDIGKDSTAFKAHIDWRSIKENLEAVKANVANRNSRADPDKVVKLYDDWRELQNAAEQLRSDRNANAKAMKDKMDQQQRQDLIEQGKVLKEKLAELEERLGVLENQLQMEGQKLPNMTHPEAPIGGEDAAKVVREYGLRPEFGFEPKDHLFLGEVLGLIDFETGAKRAVARGFEPLTTPDLVRASVLEKCGFQPRAENTQVYAVEDSQLCLTGTAEVPLAAVHMDEILAEEQLPIKLAAFGHCFRTEAGAAGSASRGLYRVHQFSKVEMFVLCTPQQSEALLEELCKAEEEMYDELGLHFKVLDMPTGDMGAPAYRKLDIEAWMPGLQRYGEISSASNCTDYQSRRLNIRFRPVVKEDPISNGTGGADKKKAKKVPTEFVHTLNATACAVPRMVVAILENFQREDGSVAIPDVLQPFMGGQSVIQPPNSRAVAISE